MATVETIQKQRKTVLTITKYHSADDITQHKCYYDYLRQLQLALPFADKNVLFSFVVVILGYSG